MKPPKLNIPDNYYIYKRHLSPDSKEWEIFDSNIPNTDKEIDLSDFPHRPVARIEVFGGPKDRPGVYYWPVSGGTGDWVECESLDAAIKHFETMVGLGLVGHGYTKEE